MDSASSICLHEGILAKGQSVTSDETLAVESHTMYPPGNVLNGERRDKSLLVIDPVSDFHGQIFDVPGVWLHYEIRENTNTPVRGPFTTRKQMHHDRS